MITKTVNKLIGLKKDDFDNFILSGQIQFQSARLIPALKTGDEMALTSIFLSSLRLVKEYRDSFFKDVGLSRNGKIYFFTEATFKDISNSRLDGLIIVVVKGKIVDAAALEMKSGKNLLDKEQISNYIGLCKKLKITKLITVSNEFVADKSLSPLDIKVPRNFELIHFSWTYLITKGQILLFKNETNIEDADQVEIMKEVLFYFENPQSGVRGYSQMKPGWKELCENIHAHKPLKKKDSCITDSIISWHEEERDMSLLLSRKIGVLVKPSFSSKDRLKKDINNVVEDNCIFGGISIKDSVSDIKIRADFERRVISMSIKIVPPQNKSNGARITWISKQLETCNRKSNLVFDRIRKDIWVECNIKFAQDNYKINLSDLGTLSDSLKGYKEIQVFHIVLNRSLGSKFASPKRVIENLEEMILSYYEGVVQHMVNWKKPAPKVVVEKKEVWEEVKTISLVAPLAVDIDKINDGGSQSESIKPLGHNQ